jgi:dephospho-CoA kinase
MVIVGIHGKMRSGKTTAANYLIDCHGYVRMSFGDALKEAAHMIFNIPMAELYSDNKSKYTREVLQKLGTECCRTLDPDVWVKALERKLLERHKTDTGLKIVIDDVRFKNEAYTLKNIWNATIVKLVLNYEDDVTTEIQRTHLSEIDLDGIPDTFFHAVYSNTGTKQELYRFMDTVAHHMVPGEVNDSTRRIAL